MTELLLGRKEIVRGNRRWQGFIKQQTDFSSDSTSLLKAFIDSLTSVVSDSVSHIIKLTDKMTSLESIINSDNLLTPQSSVLPVVCLSISLAETQGSSLFKGKNVTNFLKCFKDFCKEHNLEEAQQLQHLPHYCNVVCVEVIWMFSNYEHGDWKSLCAQMKKEWHDLNIMQIQQTHKWLKQIKMKECQNMNDVKSYCQEFNVVSVAVAKAGKLNQYIHAQWFINGLPSDLKCKTAHKCHLDINDPVTMKYETIYGFVLTSMEEEWILNAFKRSAEKASDLNKLVSATHNNKDPIPLLNEPHKASVVKWKAENMSVNKLTKQMKALTLTLKIALTVSASASSYPPVTVPQPAIAYTPQMNFSAPATAAAAVGNLRSAVAALGPNQCAFCQLEGHQKLWNEEPSCSSLIMFIQTGKVHLNANKQIAWEITDKLGSKVTLDIQERKCQTETVKKTLKNLSEL